MEVLDLFQTTSFIAQPKKPQLTHSSDMLFHLVVISSVLALAASLEVDPSSETAYAAEPIYQAPLVSSSKHDVHEPGPDDPLNLAKASAFMGLMTYANIPYVHCLADEASGEEYKGEKYDIAVLGAPFDTVSNYVQCLCAMRSLNGVR